MLLVTPNNKGLKTSKFYGEAQKKYPNLDFEIIERSKLKKIKTNSFDKVIMTLVLPSVSNKKELRALFREASRVLKIDGEIISSTLHPLMIRDFKDAVRQVKIPKTMNYFSTGARFENTVILPDRSFMSFTNSHWTMENISNELIANDFVITEIKEPKMSKNKHWHLLKDILNTPFYIFIKAKKLKKRC